MCALHGVPWCLISHSEANAASVAMELYERNHLHCRHGVTKGICDFAVYIYND